MLLLVPFRKWGRIAVEAMQWSRPVCTGEANFCPSHNGWIANAFFTGILVGWVVKRITGAQKRCVITAQMCW